MYESTITIEHDGHRYSATVTDDKVTITRDNIWAGMGTWTGTRIVDCPADLPEEVYVAIERAVVEGDVDSQSEEPEAAE